MPLYIPELGTAQPEFTISGQVNYPSHLYVPAIRPKSFLEFAHILVA